MQQEFLKKLNHLLTAEETLVERLKETRAARKLSAERKKLLEHLRKLVKIAHAQECYAHRQAKALGLDPAQG